MDTLGLNVLFKTFFLRKALSLQFLEVLFLVY